MTVTQHPWWKDTTIYQIYPASFKDSNGDGVGDIPGIISQLDYIEDLGVGAIWVSPMYDSPQVDMGYDISDYESVYPPYGTVADMEKLIQDCHSRGIRVLLDLVVNHTSDQHKWFKESRSSKDHPKRDWYIWRPAKYDEQGNRHPPNNWRGNFGGSVWEWDDATQEYYLHLFCTEQPDLNWENAETRAAIYESAMEFWLRKGVDGFRVDTVNMYSKDPEYRDAPVIDVGEKWQFAASLYCNGPRMHEYLSEMNTVLEKYGAMTVGELPHTHDKGHVVRYVSAKAKQLSMTFMFDVVDVGFGADQKFDTTPRRWELPMLKHAIETTQDLIEGTDAWTTSFLENHDQARSISRFGSDKTPEGREKSGKMLSMLVASLSGTLFVYQGQEIGMTNVPESWPIEEYKDVDSNNYYNFVKAKTNADPAALARTKAAIQHLARDHARTPIQWDGSKNGGFSTNKPWMRVNDNYPEVNVRREAQDKNSILSFWKQMLRLRKEQSNTFVHGIFTVLDKENNSTFVFEKKGTNGKAIVALNFTETDQSLALPSDSTLKRLTGNYDDEVSGTLRPFEGRIYLTQ
ncbi:hypothetical protein VE01_03973 [Pseudogymnoascus verrucosus]|uniref:Alpha-glucosidase n=1 Tax=Pseudogymnoascus verrucosus TaxID=342668 RepID=A0A1B8GPZ7_9PEZI|nr:uncharacterized protein VE01_03973 [Pseudogymnoascus verrucosus]OBT97898.1 hypothetical protein VE01_03973 [Pseudogymnoascus verrucosus]